MESIVIDRSPFTRRIERDTGGWGGVLAMAVEESSRQREEKKTYYEGRHGYSLNVSL